MTLILALALIALGMAVDAFYQHRIRIAECNAYDTGYRQGQKECKVMYVHNTGKPSMDPPVKMPDTFEERMHKHGQATVWMKK